ncbi:hypothetical protein TNCV_3476311 [Trichonephila clavipes]|nr:hypothetical protein TNCV_3476311 [Trichonephila clavipes]
MVHNYDVLRQKPSSSCTVSTLPLSPHRRSLQSASVPCLNCGGGDTWCHHLSSFREFHRANSYCHLYGAQGEHVRRISSPLPR